MVQLALAYQPAQQRLNQGPVLRGGGEDEEIKLERVDPRDLDSDPFEPPKGYRRMSMSPWDPTPSPGKNDEKK